MFSSKKNLVVANQLVKGRYQLTKEEQNFIYLIISQINKDDVDFKEYQIHIKDLESAELTQKQYGRYKDFARKLRSREIIIEDDKQILVSGWFSDIIYIKNTGYIRATISSKLKPYLLQLKQEFTQAKLPTLLQFNSKYSSRLYLLLKSEYDKQKKFKSSLFINYDIEFLNIHFELPISYINKYQNFKNRFLLSSLQEINEKTELGISFKELKTGRKITSIQFCISAEKENDISIEQLAKQIESTETKSDCIPHEQLSNRAIEILLSDELDFKNSDLKHVFEHYRIEDIEDICLELWRSWDSDKLISRQGFFRGKLKLLNRRKTQNISMFGFDEV